jgi:hypothetical protein
MYTYCLKKTGFYEQSWSMDRQRRARELDINVRSVPFRTLELLEQLEPSVRKTGQLDREGFIYRMRAPGCRL